MFILSTYCVTVDKYSIFISVYC
ncbi:hypothetical protein FYJ71_08110 [Peptostreptococcus anaerobius]|uniref:Uncharacterized protein n=1 Tax=Peptostreptococcus porci TaxID=2652282 RepID=A0A6N7XH55_9FIRM|nr:hypothetical protein [Peptostreptococcus porci]